MPYDKVVFKVVTYGSPEYIVATALRQAVLRTPLGLTFQPEELAQEKDHIHVVGLQGSDMLATASLVPEGKYCKMQRVAVKENLRGSGLGSQMVKFCEAYAKSEGFEWIYCHARDSAVNFYLKNQYTTEGDYFEKCTILHILMKKILR